MSKPPTPPSGTTCAEHPAQAATAYCSACYRPVCDECLDSSAREPRCRRCSVNTILAAFEREQAAREERKVSAAAEAAKRDPRKARWTRYALVGTFVVLAIVLLATFPSRYLKGRPVYGYHRPAGDTPGLDGCLRELWRVRRALDDYLALQGSVPATLSEACGGQTPCCPECGEPYTYYRQDDTHYIVLCPRPSVHLVGGVQVNSGSAPSVVKEPPRWLEPHHVEQ